MKEWPFQQRRQLPITSTSNVRILKLWNLTVCSVHSAPHPITTQSLDGGEGKMLRCERELWYRVTNFYLLPHPAIDGHSIWS